MNEKPLFLLTDATPRDGLFEQVVSHIQARRNMSRLWRIRVSVSISLASIVALVPVTASLAKSFAASHFGIYLSLVFSDTGVAFSYWKEVGMSLLESVPAAALTLTLGLVVLLIWSMRTAIRSGLTRQGMTVSRA